MLEVIRAGLETAIQDLPGRVGASRLGIPPSGPMDRLAFSLANALVGNPVEAAALEIQFHGPVLRFGREAAFAVTGANLGPTLDGTHVPLWQTIPAGAGQVLAFSPLIAGARAYLAVDGGMASSPVLGSRSTFRSAGIGGLDGAALTDGALIQLGPRAAPVPIRRVGSDAVPHYDREWVVEVMAGPHDDWLDEAGRQAFLGSTWTVHARSDRTGCRLEGPDLTFARKAFDKPAENGLDPSNIMNYGYAVGALDLCGRTPIILPVDGPSSGGFITPYTVISASLWKIGQTKPGDRVRFKLVTMAEAVRLRAELDHRASPASLVPAD
jgi:biotin-dependent carboxylase-like uncharacterized protein